MWLINTSSLCFEEFHDSKIPRYAILSHTWGPEEVTFQRWAEHERATKTSGFKKVEAACQLAKRDGYTYMWADTACIDKSSSAELTEAINSMFAWYAQSNVCYAYLADVPTFKPISYREEFCRSRWFKRGWTLQELLAPRNVVFYAADWTRIGTKATLARPIASATGIDVKHLFSAQSDDEDTPTHYSLVHETPIGEKMSWLARRETTRIEDMAYCMLGLFGIYMPLVYGEGTRAFLRLQEELFKVSDDHTIFCWSWATGNRNGSLVAPRPQSFLDAACYLPLRAEQRPLPYALTNAGLSIKMPLIACWSSWIGILGVQLSDRLGQVGLPMSRSLANRRFRRHEFPDCPIPLCEGIETSDTQVEHLFFPAGVSTKWERSQPLVSLTEHIHSQIGVVLSFGPRESFASIQTMPPDRFSERHSILEICPPRTSVDNVDHVQEVLQSSPLNFGGATMVEFTLENGQKELILFIIKFVSLGSYYQPQWLYFHLPRSFQRCISTEAPVERAKLEMDLQDRTYIETLITESVNWDMDFSPTNGSRLSARMAPSPFTTNAASVLKHVHIDVKMPAL